MRLWNALQNLIMYSKQFNIDIALVSEPPITHGKITESKHFNVIQYERSNNEYRNKTAILIFNSYLITINTGTYATPNIVRVIIKTSQETITLISTYIEPTSNLDQFLNEITDQFNTDDKVIIAGDLNARSKIWGDVVTNNKGKHLEDFVETHDLIIVNKGQSPTFETIRNGKRIFSTVDVTFCTTIMADLIHAWEVNDKIHISSNHNAITYILRLGNSTPLNLKATYNTKHTNWNSFRLNFNRRIKELGIKRVLNDCNNPAQLDHLVQ